MLNIECCMFKTCPEPVEGVDGLGKQKSPE
jgi:hypothetical protein